MVESRTDLALLWDLRVDSEFRRRGLGARLLASAESWARSGGCRELKVETQNINVAACRFYEKQAFELRAADPDAYPHFPGEVRLLWYKALSPPERIDAG